MMKGSMSTDLGIITINPEVIAKYAGSMAIECFGIVGMAAVNMKDGLVHLLKRLVGFALFWLSVGMVIMMFLSDIFWGTVLVIMCLILAYCLFCK